MPIPKSLIDDAGDAVRSVIRAFHGSPYDFDRFDASKIGTGEGAQAYGHGMYFAGNEDIGRYYRDSLARRSVVAPDGTEAPFPEWLSDNMMQTQGLDHYRNHWRDTLIPSQMRAGKDVSALARDLQAMDALASGGKLKPLGRMYEVEIAHPAHSLLDWDRSLSDQQHLLPQVERAINTIPDPAARYDNMLAIEDPESFKGKEVYGVLRHYLGGDVAASRAMLGSGIPGMRYLDGPSRSSAPLVKAGSQNTLMFPGTEDSIRILRKYSLLAPMAAGVGAAGSSDRQ